LQDFASTFQKIEVEVSQLQFYVEYDENVIEEENMTDVHVDE